MREEGRQDILVLENLLDGLLVEFESFLLIILSHICPLGIEKKISCSHSGGSEQSSIDWRNVSLTRVNMGNRGVRNTPISPENATHAPNRRLLS